MSKQEMEIILEIAQKLVGHLPKEMNDQVTELIVSAKNKQNPTDDVEKILKLLKSNENIRRWLREQVSLQNSQQATTNRYGAPAGDPHRVPASQKWICPEADCTESLPVIQANEDAPRCRIHDVEMVPARTGG